MRLKLCSRHEGCRLPAPDRRANDIQASEIATGDGPSCASLLESAIYEQFSTSRGRRADDQKGSGEPEGGDQNSVHGAGKATVIYSTHTPRNWKEHWRASIIKRMGESATTPRPADGVPSPKARAIPRVIAVDGSAASGKSTVGRRLAARLAYPFLDTGIMYRAITWAALDRGIDVHDDAALSELAASTRLEVGVPPPGTAEAATITIEGVDVTSQLRQADVEDAVSLVSKVPGVREALVTLQREIAGRQAMVMAGRDIGTVVLPGADLKVYLDASLEERAGRRHREFAAQKRDVTHGMVLEDLRRRDQIDSERAVSPLRPADDAVVIGTDGLTQDQVLDRVLELAGDR